MVAIIISIILLAILILIAVRLISSKRPQESAVETGFGASGPLIHASGIYSIVRKSPREGLLAVRPREGDVRKYLSTINEDIQKRPLGEVEKQKLLTQWHKAMETNVKEIEQGDCEDVSFYYIDFPKDKPCPLCESFFKRGLFVTREEIFATPSLIPPFHLGCTTRLLPYHGKEDLRDTAIMGMAPLFKGSTPPALPDWEQTVSPI